MNSADKLSLAIQTETPRKREGPISSSHLQNSILPFKKVRTYTKLEILLLVGIVQFECLIKCETMISFD